MTKPILTLPCKYTLNDFEQRGDLHHCQSCNHSLIDFRNATDEEIHTEINKNNGGSCGIFNASQVQAKSTTYQLGFKQRIGLSLLGILGFISPTVLTSCETPDPEGEKKDIKEEIAFSKLKFPLYLRGKLVDEVTKKPLSKAKITFLQYNYELFSGETDENGHFSIQIKGRDFANPHFDLILEQVGYISDTLFDLDPDNKEKLTHLSLSLHAEPITVEYKYVEMDPMIEYSTLGFVGLDNEPRQKNDLQFYLDESTKKKN